MLAVILARKMKWMFGSEYSVADAVSPSGMLYRWHMAATDLENATEVLFRLGLAYGAEPNSDLWDLTYPQWPAAVGNRGHSTDGRRGLPSHYSVDPSLAICQDWLLLSEGRIRLIEAALSLICDYGSGEYAWLGSIRGKKNNIDTVFQKDAVDALSSLGLAISDGTHVRWPDAIGPYAISSYMWEEEDLETKGRGWENVALDIIASAGGTGLPVTIDPTRTCDSWAAAGICYLWDGRALRDDRSDDFVLSIDEAYTVATYLKLHLEARNVS